MALDDKSEWQKVRDAASQKEAAKTRALRAARIAAETAAAAAAALAPPVVKPPKRRAARKTAAPDASQTT
jgi:hypothetical protein